VGAPDQNRPIAPHDHEASCKFCVACPASALLSPDTFASAGVDFAMTPVRWHAFAHFVSDRDFFAGKQARGPPALT